MSQGDGGKSAAGTPELVRVELDGEVMVVRLNRPDKRNALNDDCIHALEAAFRNPPKGARAALLCGEGEHFSAGLDLSSLKEMSASDGVMHSRLWHRGLNEIQFGALPVVAVLHGAVIGGGLELACTAQIRVAEPSAYYALPEGQRGIFVGGGGSVRVPRLIGVARMADMMLTGRIYDAAEGERIGLSQYLVGAGEGFAKGMELARRIAQNAPLTNYAVVQALPRIADASHDGGLFTESLMSAVAQSDEEAKSRIRAFFEKRAPKVGK